MRSQHHQYITSLCHHRFASMHHHHLLLYTDRPHTITISIVIMIVIVADTNAEEITDITDSILKNVFWVISVSQ